MLNNVIQGMISAIVGAVAFVAVKALVDGLDSSTWSSAEQTMVGTILPLGIAIMVVVGIFLGLTKVRGV